MTKPDSYTLVDYNKIVESFHKESDRGAAILASSFIEVFLEKLIRHFLRKDTIVNKLFDGYGPLSTFASKSDMAFSIGYINKNIHRDLKFIRKIRNHFAHHPGEASFDKNPVKDYCKELSTAQSCYNPKSMYLISVGLAVGGMHNTILANSKQRSRKLGM